MGSLIARILVVTVLCLVAAGIVRIVDGLNAGGITGIVIAGLVFLFLWSKEFTWKN